MAALGALSVLLILALAVLVLCSCVIASHRARSAADLAALAGASATSCAEAERVASRQGASVVACRVEGRDVEIEVVVAPRGTARRFGPAHAVARAGPERSTADPPGTVDLGPRPSDAPRS